MNRETLETEIYDTFNEVESSTFAKCATNSLMKKIDEYVEDAVIAARLEIMKNFGAI